MKIQFLVVRRRGAKLFTKKFQNDEALKRALKYFERTKEKLRKGETIWLKQWDGNQPTMLHQFCMKEERS